MSATVNLAQELARKYALQQPNLMSQLPPKLNNVATAMAQAIIIEGGVTADRKAGAGIKQWIQIAMLETLAWVATQEETARQTETAILAKWPDPVDVTPPAEDQLPASFDNVGAFDNLDSPDTITVALVEASTPVEATVPPIPAGQFVHLPQRRRAKGMKPKG